MCLSLSLFQCLYVFFCVCFGQNPTFWLYRVENHNLSHWPHHTRAVRVTLQHMIWQICQLFLFHVLEMSMCWISAIAQGHMHTNTLQPFKPTNEWIQAQRKRETNPLIFFHIPMFSNNTIAFLLSHRLSNPYTTVFHFNFRWISPLLLMYCENSSAFPWNYIFRVYIEALDSLSTQNVNTRHKDSSITSA